MTAADAQRAISILQSMAKKKGLAGYCGSCSLKGDYGQRHEGCGGYFTDDLPNSWNLRDELADKRGLFFCNACGHDATGAWKSLCGMCGHERTSREQTTGPDPASGVATVRHTIDPKKVRTAEDRRQILAKCWDTMDTAGGPILVEIVGSGIQPIDTILELAQWLDRVDIQTKKN